MPQADKFRIEAIPNKGQGVVATEAIAAGELVLSESPLFTQSLVRSAATIARALASRSKGEQREYLTLANAHLDKMPCLLSIFDTNALPCGANDAVLGSPAQSAGIFLRGARFNSSCIPNVNNYWNEQKQAIEFHASRDIQEGEEMCISYSGLLLPHVERQIMLKKKFGFDCECNACLLVGDDLKKSDDRRKTISRLLGDEIPACGSTPAIGLRKVKVAFRLLEQEGFVLYQDTLSYDAFQFCVSVSDYINAKAWAKKAWSVSCILAGIDSEQAKTNLNFSKNPQSHRNAGRLGKLKLSGPE